MGTGGGDKVGAQKNNPLSNEKAKKKKKVLVRVSHLTFCCSHGC